MAGSEQSLYLKYLGVLRSAETKFGLDLSGVLSEIEFKSQFAKLGDRERKQVELILNGERGQGFEYLSKVIPSRN